MIPTALLIPGVSFTGQAYVVAEPRRPTVIVDPGARDGKWFTVAEDFEWASDTLRLFVPRGYRFDGASVPRILEPLLHRLQLGLLAPVFHDPLYQGGGKMVVGWQEPHVRLDRDEVDWLFYVHMVEDGVDPAIVPRAYEMVRRFGASSWKGDT
jgi:hypothetical protein